IRSGNCTWKHGGVGNWPKRWQVAAGSNTYGRNKRDDVWCAVSQYDSQRKTITSTIGFGGAEAVRTQPTTWSCCTPTVIGKSMCRKDGRKRPRPARGVREGLSYMNGNIHV